MSNETKEQPQSTKTKKPGFFQKVVSKLDASMKDKADAKAQQSSGCCSGSDKGGKCC